MTRTRITLLVIETCTEAPESERAGDTELVRARPIRNCRTTDTSGQLAQRLDGLAGWLAKRSA